MHLYVATNVAIKPNWQMQVEIMILKMTILRKFEKVIEENSKETLVQNILNLEQIIDDD
jgi:hypothetical protein